MATLTRDKKNGKIAGVCAGLGKYFGIDPLLVRLLFIFMVLWAGIGIIPYIVLWLLIPAETTGE